MRKKIRFYPQSDHTKCGPACMVMLLDFYQRIDRSAPGLQKRLQGLEKQLYDVHHSRTYRIVTADGKEQTGGVTAAAMARCLGSEKYRLYPTVLHSSPQLLENRDEYLEPELFERFRAEYIAKLQDCSHRVTVRTGEVLNCDALRAQLDAGRKVAVEIVVDGDADGVHDKVLHWVLVGGYEGDIFWVYDPNPNSRKRPVCAQEMEQYMDTPLGKIWVAVTDTADPALQNPPPAKAGLCAEETGPA